MSDFVERGRGRLGPDELTALDGPPVLVAGAGPVGLITALGLTHYGLPVVVLEADDSLSTDTKAGTVLTRTLEVLDRYGVVDEVLKVALRIERIADIERGTGEVIREIDTSVLSGDTRFPFIVNIPQHHLEPILARELERRAPGSLLMRHRVLGFEQDDEGVTVRVEAPDGEKTLRGCYLLGCDGGRSTVRRQLGVHVEGKTLEERYTLVDVKVDLDVEDQRDYPYLAYFADPDEWMILVRQPEFWRFLWPRKPDQPPYSEERLAAKVRDYIGDVSRLEVVGSYEFNVHVRAATTWRDGRVFLMGDAAHLLTPMWALGLNTGVLDASNLPWRLAWVRRGWADASLLDAYEEEQKPLAIHGSGEMAEAARRFMTHQADSVEAMTEKAWANAMTRSMLGMRLDVDGTGEWRLASVAAPGPVRPGDRVPDLRVWAYAGETSLHRLTRHAFVALHFVDARRRPTLPADEPGLLHRVVSRWDAPLDSGLRERALFDPGGQVQARLGVPDGSVLLLRPDEHVAGIAPPSAGPGMATELYRRVVRAPVRTAMS